MGYYINPPDDGDKIAYILAHGAPRATVSAAVVPVPSNRTWRCSALLTTATFASRCVLLR